MKQRTYRIVGALLGLALVAATATACGDDDSTPQAEAEERPIVIVDPRIPDPPANLGGAYMVIENHGSEADRLISAASDVAATVELHQTRMENGAMRMSKVEGMDIPAHGQFKLERGGYHIMLIDLMRDLQPGDEVGLTLTFTRAGQVQVVARVIDAVATEAPPTGTGTPGGMSMPTGTGTPGGMSIPAGR